VPQVITHEKVLRDCQPVLKQFLSTMDLLDEKLGPLLFQFGYFNKKAFPDLEAFLARLVPFLKTLPSGYRFALEIRNKNWLSPKLPDVLRERGIALALIDQAWMPRPAEWLERFPSDDGPITADFTYIRWLGDRKGIERLTKTWDKTILDCREPLQEGVKVCRQTVRRPMARSARRFNYTPIELPQIGEYALLSNRAGLRPQPTWLLRLLRKG